MLLCENVILLGNSLSFFFVIINPNPSHLKTDDSGLKSVLPQSVLDGKDIGFYEHVVALYEDVGCSEQVVLFSNLAIQAIRTSNTANTSSAILEENRVKLSKLWKSVFMHCLNQGKYDEAYNAIVSNPILDT